MGRLNAARHLRSDEAIADYLALAVKEGDKNLLRTCLKDAARARMVNKFAEDTGLDRLEYWRLLEDTAEPEENTVTKMMETFDLREGQPVG